MKIKFITGVMGAGKSKGLIDNYNSSLHNKKYPLVLTLSFTEDNLTISEVKSRNGEVVPAIAISINQQSSFDFEVIKNSMDQYYDCVYIDESQFLDIKTIQQLIDICNEKNKDITFYGLSRTFTGDYFDASEFFLSILDEGSIELIESVCERADCFEVAEWNARLIDGNIVTTGDVLMEEKSTYQSLCSSHFLHHLDV